MPSSLSVSPILVTSFGGESDSNLNVTRLGPETRMEKADVSVFLLCFLLFHDLLGIKKVETDKVEERDLTFKK